MQSGEAQREVAAGVIAASLMKNRHDLSKDGTALEREVARIYALLGAEVETRVLICGYEIDVLATFKMGPLRVRVVAECKEYSELNRVADSDMRGFVVKLLAAREAGQADKGVFLTTSTYAKTARATAERHGIQCLTLNDLRNQLVDFSPYITSASRDFESSPLCRYYIEQRASDIEDYTAILSREEAQRYIHAPLGKYVSDLFLSGERRLALLGNFGTGKSSFCESYCYELLCEHKKDSSQRLPVRIHLRDFRSGLDIHQLIAGVLHRNFGVSVDERLCIELQRMGRFIFLLDGLDEMSTKVDRSVLNENLRELSRLATDGDNKYLVTCRTHFFQERVVDEFLEEYRVLYLLDWDRDDLRRYLEKRFPQRWRQLFERVTGNPRLEELSRTPQFVDMLLSGLPERDVADSDDFTSLELYEKYVGKWVEHESRRRGAVMGAEKRREFVEYLARKLFEEELSGIHFSQLYEVAREFSGYGDATRLDYFDTDVRNCTFITRNSTGTYGFRHRSFMEYGCASTARKEIKNGQPSLLQSKELTEEILQFLGDMEFKKADLEVLHSWSCLEYNVAPRRILALNASRILLALRSELRGVAAERFRVVDDPWTRIGTAIASNDAQLFDKTVDASYKWFLSYIRRYSRLYSAPGDELGSEEILQEVLVRLWTMMGSENPPATVNFRAWISQLIRRYIVDRSRLVQRRREIPLDVVEQGALPVNLVISPPQETLSEIMDVIATHNLLSDMEKDMFMGRYLEGKRFEELAKEYSISTASVRVRIYSARRKILDRMHELKARGAGSLRPG